MYKCQNIYIKNKTFISARVIILVSFKPSNTHPNANVKS